MHTANSMDLAGLETRATNRSSVLIKGGSRWRHWEFWPAWAFYPPVVARCLWLALKYRGFRLPTCANPGMFSGGVVGESKIEILRALMRSSLESTACAAIVEGRTVVERMENLQRSCRELGISAPFVLKPDIGQRGVGFKLVEHERDAEQYLVQMNSPVVVQRYAAGPGELGVFYYRFPGESCGRIFAITEKLFPCVIGDGKATVRELIESDLRARFMSAVYRRRFGEKWDRILARGERLKLVEAGNHAQGCIFVDGSRFITDALAQRIDEISKKIDGFYIGRYDIRFTSEEEVMAGRGFQIIELNGAAAESTNIYDARNSLAQAYATLFRQWELVYRIGSMNRRLGVAPTPWRDLWRAWSNARRQIARYPVAD